MVLICFVIHRNRPPFAWWIGPAKRRAVCGVMYAANGANVLLPPGLLANLTVSGSKQSCGIVPFRSLIATSASDRWSKRMKPTPFDEPATAEDRFFNEKQKQWFISNIKDHAFDNINWKPNAIMNIQHAKLYQRIVIAQQVSQFPWMRAIDSSYQRHFDTCTIYEYRIEWAHWTMNYLLTR